MILCAHNLHLVSLRCTTTVMNCIHITKQIHSVNEWINNWFVASLSLRLFFSSKLVSKYRWNVGAIKSQQTNTKVYKLHIGIFNRREYILKNEVVCKHCSCLIDSVDYKSKLQVAPLLRQEVRLSANSKLQEKEESVSRRYAALHTE